MIEEAFQLLLFGGRPKCPSLSDSPIFRRLYNGSKFFLSSALPFGTFRQWNFPTVGPELNSWRFSGQQLSEEMNKLQAQTESLK